MGADVRAGGVEQQILLCLGTRFPSFPVFLVRHLSFCQIFFKIVWLQSIMIPLLHHARFLGATFCASPWWHAVSHLFARKRNVHFSLRFNMLSFLFFSFLLLLLLSSFRVYAIGRHGSGNWKFGSFRERIDLSNR